LDIGQGDAIYFQDRSGTSLLVDTGPKDDGVIARIQEATRCRQVHIDYLMLTHPDADHIGEAERLIQKGLVGQVIHNGFLDIDQGEESATENRLEKVANSKRDIEAGDSFYLGSIHVETLFPIGKPYQKKPTKGKKVDDNDFSLVTRISINLDHGTTSFMLTGDAPQKAEQLIIDSGHPELLKADILKLGHHGSKNSSSAKFLSAVSPSEVVVSAGKNNTYHHPNEETLQRVEAQNVQSKKPLLIRETFLEGTIVYK
jgi:beta-lactamase superfamily II metal-dependent hydrolase